MVFRKQFLIILLFCISCGQESNKITLSEPLAFFTIDEINFSLSEDVSPVLSFRIKGNARKINNFILRADCFNDNVEIKNYYTSEKYKLYFGQEIYSKKEYEIEWILHYFYNTNKVRLKIDTIYIDKYDKIVCNSEYHDCQIKIFKFNGK